VTIEHAHNLPVGDGLTLLLAHPGHALGRATYPRVQESARARMARRTATPSENRVTGGSNARVVVQEGDPFGTVLAGYDLRAASLAGSNRGVNDRAIRVRGARVRRDGGKGVHCALDRVRKFSAVGCACTARLCATCHCAAGLCTARLCATCHCAAGLCTARFRTACASGSGAAGRGAASAAGERRGPSARGIAAASRRDPAQDQGPREPSSERSPLRHATKQTTREGGRQLLHRYRSECPAKCPCLAPARKRSLPNAATADTLIVPTRKRLYGARRSSAVLPELAVVGSCPAIPVQVAKSSRRRRVVPARAASQISAHTESDIRSMDRDA
jgi:hypothetical protein